MKDIKIKLKNAGKFIVIKMIRLYQLAISPYKGGKYCSFIPTCSQYAIEAIEMYGVFLGGWLALKRILRCNQADMGKEKSNKQLNIWIVLYYAEVTI